MKLTLLATLALESILSRLSSLDNFEELGIQIDDSQFTKGDFSHINLWRSGNSQIVESHYINIYTDGRVRYVHSRLTNDGYESTPYFYHTTPNDLNELIKNFIRS